MIALKERSKTFEITTLPFGVRIESFDARSASVETCREIRELAYAYKLVVIGDQDLDPGQYVDFGRKLGKPQVYLQANYHHPDHPEIFVSANGPVEGRTMGVARTGYFWHSDCSFEPQPLAFTMIYPQILPRGERSTRFMDMEAALRRLPDEIRGKISDLFALHDGNSRYKIPAEDVGKPLHEILDFLAKKCPYAVHPMVARHPVTDKEILYVNTGFTSRILGISVFESWSLLSKIFAVSEDMQFAHFYEWREGDIALWDNRALLHRSGAIPANEVSAMFRIGLYDEYPLAANSVENLNKSEVYPWF